MTFTRKLHIDLETRSILKLPEVGVYRYAEEVTTEVILYAYRIDDGPVRLVRIGHHLPWAMRDALEDPACQIVAHNAGFERVMIERHLAPRYGWPVPALERWDCTMARALRQALPRSLDGASKAARLPFEKDAAGHRLMMQMCKPRRIEDDGTIVWWDDEERRQKLGDYCVQDVIVECALDDWLYALPDSEREIWQLTERMNDRGVPIDLEYVQRAKAVAEAAIERYGSELQDITGCAVKSVSDVNGMKKFLGGLTSLDKAAVDEMLKGSSLDPVERRVLEIRQAAGKSSVSKLQAILNRTCEDGRARGNLVYHAASPGRWGGTGIQMQNLPRPAKGQGEDAFFEDVKTLDVATMLEVYPDILDQLSGALRGCVSSLAVDVVLYRSDYAAVEARGVAWVAGAHVLLDAFLTGKDPYKVMAEVIYGTPYDQVNDDERFVGKQTVLGCGYGMGAKKFHDQCLKFGVYVPMEICERAVAAYREANPEIPALWRGLEQAAVSAVMRPGSVTSYRNISFRMQGRFLRMRLPGGQMLFYCEPKIEEGRFGQPQLTYMGLNSMTKKWERESTWGGKLTENAVQAICRNLMAHSLLVMEDMGLDPILTVHDEGVCETFTGLDPALVARIMEAAPDWAEGFPIKAEAKVGARYGK